MSFFKFLTFAIILLLTINIYFQKFCVAAQAEICQRSRYQKGIAFFKFKRFFVLVQIYYSFSANIHQKTFVCFLDLICCSKRNIIGGKKRTIDQQVWAISIFWIFYFQIFSLIIDGF